MFTIEKNTASILDYKFDWLPWLKEGETILDHTITLPTGITMILDTVTDEGKSVTVWFSGGTSFESYEVECLIATNQERTEKRSLLIQMTNR